MKIVFVTPEFVTEKNSFDGGLAGYLFKVAKQLLLEGHEVHVCVSANTNEKFDHEGICVHRVNVRSKLISVVDVLTLKRLSTLMRWSFASIVLNRYIQKKFSNNIVVHYTSYTCPSLFNFLVTAKKKVVRLSGYQPDIYLEYKEQIKDFNYFQIKFLEDTMLKQELPKFAPSQLLANRLIGLSNAPVSVIKTPYVPSANIVASTVSDVLAERRYLLFFGSIGVLKGCMEIAEILDALLTKEKDLHFVFIGKDSRHQGRPFTEILAEKCQVNLDRIHVYDKMSRDKLYSYVRSAHRVVLPSRLDNLPNTLLESLSFERIVIATNKSSLDEVIVDGVNGYLCENSNADSLYEAISRSLQMNSAEEKVMQENIKNSLNDFHPAKHVKSLIEFYGETI